MITRLVNEFALVVQRLRFRTGLDKGLGDLVGGYIVLYYPLFIIAVNTEASACTSVSVLSEHIPSELQLALPFRCL